MNCTILIFMSIAFITPYLPFPQEKGGFGLRVQPRSTGGPFLVGEAIELNQLDITLLNYSKETLIHDYLPVTKRIGDLRIKILDPDGKSLTRKGGHFGQRDPFTQQNKLKPGTFTSCDFRFSEFGYAKLGEAGTYRLYASLKLNGKEVKSPTVELVVVGIPDKAILLSHSLTLEGFGAKLPPDERRNAVIQQVAIGNRTLLVYRLFIGPKLGDKFDHTFRLGELPGKVEMKVEGAYGAGKPLTITYKTSTTAEPTKLVINSIDGTPWTKEDEEELRERKKAMPTKP